MAQKANPSPSAISNNRPENDVGRIALAPPPVLRKGWGPTMPPTVLPNDVTGRDVEASANNAPLRDEWEWRMQSREGIIRYVTGPDDPRIA